MLLEKRGILFLVLLFFSVPVMTYNMFTLYVMEGCSSCERKKR